MLKRLCTSAAMLLGVTEAGITLDMTTDHSSDHKVLKKIEERDETSPKLTVHMVHHTHDDVGWLKTVDEYFTGTNDDIQNVQVHIILDEVVRSLTQDPNKKFSYVEMKFFSMWYYRQPEEVQNQVKTLISEGRLELINAGWSMHDEACPHYEDMIHNMMVGHDFAMQEFGVKPRIGWQIDPFGHSNTNARFFAEMGFDAWFFARLDYQDKDKRLANQEMEFIWRSSYDELGNSSQILTHALYHHYSAPSGFDFDTLSRDDPFVINEELSTYNAPERAKTFHNWIMHQKSHYRAENNLLVVMGDDFRFQNARMYFESSDNLMKYYNENYGKQYNIELIYSTPSMYVDGIAAENIEWPTKYDDMFPYGDNDKSYWTGYFASRANDKEMVRKGSHNLMASNKLYSMAAIDESTSADQLSDILDAKQTMFDVIGVLQHHDAVTGTGKQHVANNYAKKIHDGIEVNNQQYSKLISQAAENAGISADDWTWCLRSNSTYADCPIADHSDDSSFVVAVHNPAMISMEMIQIPVKHGNYKVSSYDESDKQFYPLKNSHYDVLCKTERHENHPDQTLSNCQLYAKDFIEANGIGFFKFEYDSEKDHAIWPTAAKDNQKISNGNMYLEFIRLDVDNGAEFEVHYGYLWNSKNFFFDLKYWAGQQDTSTQPSGDYIFRAEKNQFEAIRYSKLQSVEVIKGNVRSEFILNYSICTDCENSGLPSTNYQQAVVYLAVNHQLNVIDTNVKLYGLPNDADIGHEVTVNFEVKEFDNQNTFWTDSNGMAMQKRVLNYRPTWDLSTIQNMNITANYYPVQSCISMRSTDGWQMNVMNSRSQGGSVLAPGRIEFMQNRRLNVDDWRGMGEPLNETVWNGQGITVPAQYYVQLFNMDKSTSLQRTVQQMQDSPMQYFYSFDSTFTENNNFKADVFGGKVLNSHLNFDQVKIEMVPLEKNKIRVRLENLADSYDAPQQTMDLNLSVFADELYESVNGVKPAAVSIEEMSLTGNQSRADMLAKKIQWKTLDDTTVTPKYYEESQTESTSSDFLVTLSNQQIRVFEVEFVSEDGNLFIN